MVKTTLVMLRPPLSLLMPTPAPSDGDHDDDGDNDRVAKEWAKATTLADNA